LRGGGRLAALAHAGQQKQHDRMQKYGNGDAHRQGALLRLHVCGYGG
jgi:hypothetical protein